MKSSLEQYRSFSLLGGMAIGAGLMYLVDSRLDIRHRGRRHDPAEAEPISEVPHRSPVPDWVLAERTRLEMWRTLAHPDSVQVFARDGCVTLWGPALAGEPERLRERLAKLPGLRKLELQLTPWEEPAAARVA
jgi:hypothetical protein